MFEEFYTLNICDILKKKKKRIDDNDLPEYRFIVFQSNHVWLFPIQLDVVKRENEFLRQPSLSFSLCPKGREGTYRPFFVELPRPIRGGDIKIMRVISRNRLTSPPPPPPSKPWHYRKISGRRSRREGEEFDAIDSGKTV